MTKELTQDTVLYLKTDEATPRSKSASIQKVMQEKIRSQNNALLIISKTAQELERIESFVRLVQLRIKKIKNDEMERLVELAMPAVDLLQPDEILDQARKNGELRADFLKTYPALGAEDVHQLLTVH